MNKRNFLKKTALAAVGFPFYAGAASDIFSINENQTDIAVLKDDDFWAKIRSDYQLKNDYINLESGYYNIIPKPTLKSLYEHIEMVNNEGAYYMRRVQWENKKRVTARLAEVVGCSPKNLIITRNTTESLDMVIKGMHWKEGDEAVFAQQDYGAMKDMFAQVARRYGIENTIVSVPNHPKSDDELINLYAKAITPKTKLLMICHMINITGQILPVRKICEMAHSKGVQVMVDGAHCIGHIQVDVDALGCDYYGSSLHKWVAAPLGTGMLYVKSEHIDNLWPIFAESERDPGDITRLNHTGTHPVYHDLCIEQALAYYQAIGPERKEKRLRYLQEYWTTKVRSYPKIIINTPKDSQRACAIANVGIQGMKPSIMAKRLLDDYKIFTVAIDNTNVQGCRITPNVFTTTEELDTFVKALISLADS